MWKLVRLFYFCVRLKFGDHQNADVSFLAFLFQEHEAHTCHMHFSFLVRMGTCVPSVYPVLLSRRLCIVSWSNFRVTSSSVI